MTHEIFVCVSLSPQLRKNPKILASLKVSLYNRFETFGKLRCPVVAARAGAYVIAIVRFEESEKIDQVLQQEKANLTLDLKEAEIFKIAKGQVCSKNYTAKKI